MWPRNRSAVASSLSSRREWDRWPARNEFFQPRNPFSGRGDFSFAGIRPRRNHRPPSQPDAELAAPAATTREAHLRRLGAASLLKQFGKGEEDQLDGIEEGVHRH